MIACVWQVWLAFSGLLSIGLAIVFTYGLGFATGIMFGPIHQILPFMLLGKARALPVAVPSLCISRSDFQNEHEHIYNQIL